MRFYPGVKKLLASDNGLEWCFNKNIGFFFWFTAYKSVLLRNCFVKEDVKHPSSPTRQRCFLLLKCIWVNKQSNQWFLEQLKMSLENVVYRKTKGNYADYSSFTDCMSNVTLSRMQICFLVVILPGGRSLGVKINGTIFIRWERHDV